MDLHRWEKTNCRFSQHTEHNPTVQAHSFNQSDSIVNGNTVATLRDSLPYPSVSTEPTSLNRSIFGIVYESSIRTNFISLHCETDHTSSLPLFLCGLTELSCMGHIYTVASNCYSNIPSKCVVTLKSLNSSFSVRFSQRTTK